MPTNPIGASGPRFESSRDLCVIRAELTSQELDGRTHVSPALADFNPVCSITGVSAPRAYGPSSPDLMLRVLARSISPPSKLEILVPGAAELVAVVPSVCGTAVAVSRDCLSPLEPLKRISELIALAWLENKKNAQD